MVSRAYQCRRPPLLYRDGSPWPDIPLDLAGLVLSRLPAHIDRVRFAAVCRQWRAAVREVPPPLPLPLLMHGDGTAFILFTRMKKLHFPAAAGFTSACGNRILYSGNGACFLWDPLTNDVTVNLPALSDFDCRLTSVESVRSWYGMNMMHMTVIRLLLSSTTPRLVAALVRFGLHESLIAVCRPGSDPRWSVCLDERVPQFVDLAFHQGQLFAVHSDSCELSAVDISVDYGTGDPWVSGIRGVIGSALDCRSKVTGRWGGAPMIYLVDSCGALLMVHRGKDVGPDTSNTSPYELCSKFEVLKADFEQSRWSVVTTVGEDQALFVSGWQCRSLSVSQFGIRGDCIVFFQNEHESISCYGINSPRSCSVYNMRDGKVFDPDNSFVWDHASEHGTRLFPHN